MLRLDRTDATDTSSSDKGSQLVVAEIDRVVDSYATEVSKLRNWATPEEFAPLKESLEHIFALMPRTDVAFGRIIDTRSKTAPLLVVGLRKAIQRALNISATRSVLRIHALDLLIERMKLHDALAGGPYGSQFLTTFSIWLGEITAWRLNENVPPGNSVTTAEIERIARSEFLYTKAYNAMMCSKLFVPAAPAEPRSR